VLRRLSVFVGGFTLEEAQAVAACDSIGRAEVVGTLADLVAKSLVFADQSDATTRYRLLDAARDYARSKLGASGEEDNVLRRHAHYYQELLGRTRTEPSLVPQGVVVDPPRLGNIRAALDWSFSPAGDTGLGVRLAAGAALLLIEICLLNECKRRCERALAALGEDAQDPWCEMVLNAALGHVLMFTEGNSEDALAAYERAFALAEKLDNHFFQLRLLSAIYVYRRRVGDFPRLLEVAERAAGVAQAIGSTAAKAAASTMLGVSRYHNGDLREAKHLLDSSPKVPQDHLAAAGFYGVHRDGEILYPRLLWLMGFPDQAATAGHAVARAEESNPLTRCLALITAARLFQLRGDRDAVEEYVDLLTLHASEHSLGPYRSAAMGFRGEILFLRGEIEPGLSLVQDALHRLRAERYDNYTPWLTGILAQALAARGQIDQGLALVKDAIAVIGHARNAYNAPEILRIHGEILVLAGDTAEAERSFAEAMAIANKQGALSWHLRTATSLARLRVRQGRRHDARTVLAKPYSRFTEGLDTADLKAAKVLLDELGTA
jgi:predicted ATPase